MTGDVVLALGTGEGPLVNQTVSVPIDAALVAMDQPRGGVFTYRFTHLGIPPRTGPRYHLLVPTYVGRYEQVYLIAVRALMNANENGREAVRCRNASCELTSLDEPLES